MSARARAYPGLILEGARWGTKFKEGQNPIICPGNTNFFFQKSTFFQKNLSTRGGSCPPGYAHAPEAPCPLNTPIETFKPHWPPFLFPGLQSAFPIQNSWCPGAATVCSPQPVSISANLLRSLFSTSKLISRLIFSSSLLNL